MTDRHKARPKLLGYVRVTGIVGLVPQYGRTCEDCGQRVRQMTGLGGVFWHAGGRPGKESR